MKQHGIYDKMNLIVLSDHGMAPMKDDRTIFIDQYIDVTLMEKFKTLYGIVSHIYPTQGNVFLLKSLISIWLF